MCTQSESNTGEIRSRLRCENGGCLECSPEQHREEAAGSPSYSKLPRLLDELASIVPVASGEILEGNIEENAMVGWWTVAVGMRRSRGMVDAWDMTSPSADRWLCPVSNVSDPSAFEFGAV